MKPRSDFAKSVRGRSKGVKAYLTIQRFRFAIRWENLTELKLKVGHRFLPDSETLQAPQHNSENAGGNSDNL